MGANVQPIRNPSPSIFERFRCIHRKVQKTFTCDQKSTGRRPNFLITITANIPPIPIRKILQLQAYLRLGKHHHSLSTYFEETLLITLTFVLNVRAKGNNAAIPVEMRQRVKHGPRSVHTKARIKVWDNRYEDEDQQMDCFLPFRPVLRVHW